MHVLWVIVMGFVIGLIARLLMPGRDAAGFIMTTVLGVVGALVGSYLGTFLGLYHEGEPAGFLMSLIGALVVLLAYHMIAHKPAVTL